MAFNISGRHATSDEYHNPYCDPCYRGKELNVKVQCYCNDCDQHLCSDCYFVHWQLKSSRRHLISWGDAMPKSTTEKPPKFEQCELHPKLLKSQFCSNHRTLLCSSCCADNHSKCLVESIDEACKSIPTSAIDDLYDTINGCKEELENYLSLVTKHGHNLEDQKKIMLLDSQNIYDQILENLNRIFRDIKNDINVECESQAAYFCQNKQIITDMKARLEAVVKDVENFKGKTIDTKIFLSLQESVEEARENMARYKSLSDSLYLVPLTFSPSKTIQDILSNLSTFGSISKSPSNSISFSIPEIKFPVSPIARPPAAAERSLHGSTTKASKSASYCVRLKDDGCHCAIRGIAITQDGLRILADYNNSKLKLFSSNMTYLTQISLPCQPWDVAVLSDQEVAVTVFGSHVSIVLLDISDRQLRIKRKLLLSGFLPGIAKFRDKIAVINSDSSRSLNIINKQGELYLLVSHDHQNKPLFPRAEHVCSFVDERSSRIILASSCKRILLLLNGDTGDVITRYETKNTTGSGIKCVTVDAVGNIYFCTDTKVIVLSSDLSEERILVEIQLSGLPNAIAYDEISHQIIVSYTRDYIDYFQLT